MSTPTSSETKLKNVEQSLAGISKSMKRSATVTTVVGLILIAAMIAYFVIGQREIAYLVDPGNLVTTAGDLAETSLPEIRASIEQEVAKSAPDWAAAASDQAIGAAPTIREALEDYVLDQTEAVIADKSELAEEEFRRILRENRVDFERTLNELADGEEYSEETLTIFLDAVNRELGQDMESQAQDVFGTLVALNEKARKLSSGVDLNAEERLERETLMLIRRLELQEADAEMLRQQQAEAEAAKKAADEAAAAAAAEDDAAEDDATEGAAAEDAAADSDAAASSTEDAPKGDDKAADEPAASDDSTN